MLTDKAGERLERPFERLVALVSWVSPDVLTICGLALNGVACALMGAVLGAISWPPTPAGLLAAIGSGVACYAVAALALDVSGARRWLPGRSFRRGPV